MKILIAVDDSPYSEAVIQSVAERHWPEETEFKLITVLEPILATEEERDQFDGNETLSEINARRKKAATELCEKVRKKLAKALPSARIHFEIREGIPKNEIVDSASQWSANRLLIGAHGRGSCPHNLIGSVSRAVVNNAPCSVEVVRP